jgi:iron complex transport system substrate-binding protein
MKFIIFLFIITLIAGCSRSEKNLPQTIHTNRYAHGFEVKQTTGIKKITIYNPWEQASNISFDYYLLEKGTTPPDSIDPKKIIYTPVKNVVCLSTSHVALLDVLGETENISGISGSYYISNPKIREKIKAGKMFDVGYDQGFNYELLLQQKPELVLVYGIGSEVSTQVRKMEDLGLKVFFVAEYLEVSPLGKAEWVKCLAPLFGKEQKAEEFFSSTEKSYLELKKLAEIAAIKPNVMVGLPYRDSWWVPGGKSYLANLIADAGGNYVGKDNPSHESYVVSFENALGLSANADIWINLGMVNSKKEVLAGDERIGKFPVFEKGEIFNNNNRLSPEGGNDFWESGTVCPDKILSDLIRIFHPELRDTTQLVYYKEIR